MTTNREFTMTAWDKYGKALVAAFGAALIALQSALLGDQHIDPAEGVQIGIAALAAVQVWLTANLPTAQHAKAITAGLLALLSLLVSYVSNGIDSSELTNLVIAFAVAAGVLGAPAVSKTGPVPSSDPPVREV